MRPGGKVVRHMAALKTRLSKWLFTRRIRRTICASNQRLCRQFILSQADALHILRKEDINRENGYFGSGIFLPRPVPVQRNAISVALLGH